MTSAPSEDRIKVMIVDDSPSSRVMLRKMVESDPSLVVSAMAQDAYSAARAMKIELPDVILLDLEMPGIDGMTFLRRIMQQSPLPVVICSSLTEDGSRKSVEAMEAGAVDVLPKPNAHNPQAVAESTARLCDSLHGAAMARKAPGQAPRRIFRPPEPAPKLGPDVILPPPNLLRPLPKDAPLVVIGASTGGTEALREVLCALPADCPPIAIVQHMPRGFTAAFAKRLDGLAAISIREAETGMSLGKGQAVIGMGDAHLVLHRQLGHYAVQVRSGPFVMRHRPSVDVLFRSAATVAGANTLGILLTGMGDDGALCLGEIKASGGITIAQDEASSVVFGMPGEAVRMGHAMYVLPLDRMAEAIMNFARGRLVTSRAAS